jgi:hypothetical protein
MRSVGRRNTLTSPFAVYELFAGDVVFDDNLHPNLKHSWESPSLLIYTAHPLFPRTCEYQCFFAADYHLGV